MTSPVSRLMLARPRVALSTLALATLAATCSGGAAAQAVTPDWTLTPNFSLLDADKDWGFDKNARGGGLKLGRNVSPNTELQLDVGANRVSQAGAKYRQTRLGLDGLYKFNAGSPLRPFLSAGLGLERDRLSNSLGASTGRNSPFLSAGLGLQYWFTNNVALQADVKRVQGYLGNDGLTAFGQKWSRNNLYSLGLVFGFGGAPEAARPAVMAPVAAAVAPAPVVEAPAPAPAPAPVVVPPAAPKVERITLDATELFAFNKAELRLPQPKLDDVAALVNGDASISKVTITGHTDRLGSAAANKALSQRRADAVRNYLAGKGVAANRLEALGLGASKPVKDCSDKQFRNNKPGLIDCLAPNRRVEILPVTGQRPAR